MTDKLKEIEDKVNSSPQFTVEERALLHELITLWRGIKSMGVVGKWLSAVAVVCAAAFTAIQSMKVGI